MDPEAASAGTAFGTGAAKKVGTAVAHPPSSRPGRQAGISYSLVHACCSGRRTAWGLCSADSPHIEL